MLANFPPGDLSEDVLNTDFSDQVRCFGVLLDIVHDAFAYQLSDDVRAFTRRGILSTINSIYI